MKRDFSRHEKKGFSLIEVVLAIALLGLTIVAVIGLVGVVSRSVTDVQDFTTAARITESIEDEFQRLTFAQLQVLQLPIVLYGNRTGDRVVLRDRLVPGGQVPYDPNERQAFPPRDWYYRIEVVRVGDPSLPSPAGIDAQTWENQIEYDQNYSTYMPFRVQVRWPFYIPRGPGPDDWAQYEERRQRSAVYFLTVRE